MKEKSYAVIGLGRFGMSVALTLAQENCDVLVIDDQEENIQLVQDQVTYAVKADVRESNVLKKIGVQNVDVAVIAISDNLEASIIAAVQVKDLGVPYIIAKANGELHGRILQKLGVDRVIYPERSMGVRTAKNLLSSGFLDVFELSSEISIAEFRIPEEWVGKTLASLKIRERYRLNIIGYRVEDKVEVNLVSEEPLPRDCYMIAIGKNRDLNAV